MLVQRTDIVDVSDPKQPTGQHVDNPGDDLAHVDAVDAKEPEEQQQAPCNRMVKCSEVVSPIRLLGHVGNQEQVDDPADQKESAGKEPKCTGERFAKVEAVRSGETDDPKQIANDGRMSRGIGVGGCRRGCLIQRGGDGHEDRGKAVAEAIGWLDR